MAVSGSAIAAWASANAGYIAAASAVIGAAGTYMQYKTQRSAQRSAEEASNREKLSKEEQRAQAAQQQADARRREIREERVRRARVLQMSENAGASDSSGEAGALGALSTNFAQQQGQAANAALSGQKQTQYLQDAANADYSRQKSLSQANLYGQVGQAGFSIFKAAAF